MNLSRLIGSTLATAVLASGAVAVTAPAQAAFRDPAPINIYSRCLPARDANLCLQWWGDTRRQYPTQTAQWGYPKFTQIGHAVMAKRSAYHYTFAIGADKTHLRARIADEVVRQFGLTTYQRNTVCWMIANPGFNIYR